jgi:c-di-GMP-binding flagellar brake protein YcgR
MLERTVSFWRRLLNPRTHSPGAVVLEERRVSARFFVNRPIAYQVINNPEPATYSGQLHNISAGGLNLVVDRPFYPGDLVSVLRAHDPGKSAKSALACVVHVSPTGENRWSLGCTFARKLNAEDLLPFAGQGETSALVEQRACPRHDCHIEATYYLVGEPEVQVRPASVLNLSSTGVGLLVREPLAPGLLLSIDLCPVGKGDAKTILSCVVHVSGPDEGAWAVGCNFIPQLSEADFRSLL